MVSGSHGLQCLQDLVRRLGGSRQARSGPGAGTDRDYYTAGGTGYYAAARANYATTRANHAAADTDAAGNDHSAARTGAARNHDDHAEAAFGGHHSGLGVADVNASSGHHARQRTEPGCRHNASACGNASSHHAGTRCVRAGAARQNLHCKHRHSTTYCAGGDRDRDCSRYSTEGGAGRSGTRTGCACRFVGGNSTHPGIAGRACIPDGAGADHGARGVAGGGRTGKGPPRLAAALAAGNDAVATAVDSRAKHSCRGIVYGSW